MLAQKEVSVSNGVGHFVTKICYVVLFGVAFKSRGGRSFRTHSMKTFFTFTTPCQAVPIVFPLCPIDAPTAAMSIEPSVKMHDLIGTDHIVH